MSLAHYGRAVPMALRRLKSLDCYPYVPKDFRGAKNGTISSRVGSEESTASDQRTGSEESIASDQRTRTPDIPTAVASNTSSTAAAAVEEVLDATPTTSFLVNLFPSSLYDAWHDWLSGRSSSWWRRRKASGGPAATPRRGATCSSSSPGGSSGDDTTHPSDRSMYAPPSRPFAVPEDLPEGVHLIVLLTRLKHIAHIDSWLGVRAGLEFTTQNDGQMQRFATKNEMNMYICCLLPVFLPWRLLWWYKLSCWYRQLVEAASTTSSSPDEQASEEGVEQSACPQSSTSSAEQGDARPAASISLQKLEFLTTVTWKQRFFDNMGLHNDGRAYGLLVKNDGEILWCSDDEFKEFEKKNNADLVMKAVKEEFVWRETRMNRLLEAAERKMIEGEGSGGADGGDGGVRDRARGCRDGGGDVEQSSRQGQKC